MTSASSAAGDSASGHPVPRGQAWPVLWWARDFPGGTDQAGEARHWIADLLPQCDPLDDLLLFAGELCANAVVHTRSGEPGGCFSVAVEWMPEAARVVIEDQGSPVSTAIGEKASDMAWTKESGRGLWLVDELADDWGTACHRTGRVVWADVRWQAKGGPQLEAPGGLQAAIADIAATRRAYPGTTIWWGHRTQAWWAAHPGTSGLVSSPDPDGLRKILADAHPEFQHATPAAPHHSPSTVQRSGKGNDVTADRCSCGFTELADETITDHLQQAFEPADHRGNDGQVHEEQTSLTCSCGLAAVTAEELDFHFLKMFVPDDAIGHDGRKHEAGCGT